MSYEKILKRLEELPREKQIFASGSYVYFNPSGEAECGCAVSKGIPLLYDAELVQNVDDDSAETTFNSMRFGRFLNDSNVVRTIGSLYDQILKEMADLRISDTELGMLQSANDQFDGGNNSKLARRARYLFIIDWLRAGGKYTQLQETYINKALWERNA
jgi:hypothetical protein